MQGEFLSIETAQKLAKAEKKEKAWDELKKWLEDEKSKVSKNCGVRNYKNKIKPYINTLSKIQELEGQK